VDDATGLNLGWQMWRFCKDSNRSHIDLAAAQACIKRLIRKQK
jgi:hypothetical protein